MRSNESVLRLIVIAVLVSAAFTASASLVDASPPEGRYIVVLREGVMPEGVASRHGIAPTHVYRHALNGFSAAGVSDGRLKALEKDPRVAYVEMDMVLHAIGQTLPTGVDRIEVDQNSDANIDGVDERVDVDIAIIDTGIDKDHPDLNVVGGRHFYTIDSGPPWERGANEDDNYDDDNGHGSHVAGTAAAIDNGEGVVGVAPGARLWAVKVLDSSGSGYLSDIIAGVDWVTGKNETIEVANLSLGGQGTRDSFRTSLQNCVEAGVVVVVAAGNEESDVYGSDGTFGTDDDYIPAAYPEVATISAMADSDGQSGGTGSDTSYGSDDSFASFSNFAGTVVSSNPVNSPGAAIDLLLPGVDILSTYMDGGYATGSGTSMSSPHGAGLAALYIAVNERANNADDVYAIRQALIDTGVAQDSSDGLATLNDPDAKWENIGWASSGIGYPPTVSWVNPTNNAVLSGTVTLQIDASDTEDGEGTLTVEWRVDGGTWKTTSYDTGTTCYEGTWESTEVSDGDHTLEANATDSDGNNAYASITVTTENTDNAPTVSWVNPLDGETVSGNVTIQIDANDDLDSGSEITVKWQVDEGPWQTATYNKETEYYEDTWDTTMVSDGDHNLDARATDTNGNTCSEERIIVTVSNEAGGMYVWDISWKEAGPHLKSTVTIRYDSDGDGVAESSDDPVSDASVEYNLTNQDTGDYTVYTGITDSKGQVEFMWKQAPSGTYEGEVTALTHSTYTWESSLDAYNPDYYTK